RPTRTFLDAHIPTVYATHLLLSQLRRKKLSHAALAHSCEELFNGVYHDRHFEVVDGDRDPREPQRQHGARAVERRDDELIGYPENVEPLRVEEDQVHDAPPIAPLAQLVDVYERDGDEGG